MLKQEFYKEIKAKRLTRDWYQFTGSVEGKDVALKGYTRFGCRYTVWMVWITPQYHGGVSGAVQRRPFFAF